MYHKESKNNPAKCLSTIVGNLIWINQINEFIRIAGKAQCLLELTSTAYELNIRYMEQSGNLEIHMNDSLTISVLSSVSFHCVIAAQTCAVFGVDSVGQQKNEQNYQR